MIVSEALRRAAERLSATSDTARLDAEILMAHVLGASRSDMLVRHMRDSVPEGFEALVDRRASHEPVAYITGEQEFYGLNLFVGPGVLIPRGDSETLIEAASEAFADRGPPNRILDLGTGSGALLLAALSQFPNASGCAVDASSEAEAVFRRNARRHVQGSIPEFRLVDWTEPGWAASLCKYDLILCNPPYVEQEADLDPDVRDFEPASALFAGEEGLDDYRVLIPQIGGLLGSGGVAIFEIGASQADAVSAIAKAEGFSVEARNDLANRPRCLVLR